MNTEDQSQSPAETGGEPSTAVEGETAETELAPSLADGVESMPALEAVPADLDADEDLADDLPYGGVNTTVDVPDEEPFLPPPPRRGRYELVGDDLDIDAALAAVASLSDVAAEREAYDDAQETAAQESELPVFLLPTPPAVALKRGTPASLIPALILIVTGGLLTLATTSGAAIPAPFIAFGALAAVAVLMLGYWLTAGRWARGAFFLATLLLLSAGALYWLTLPGSPGAAGTPIFIVTTGIALILTAFMSRPRTRRAFLPGLLMIVGGGVGLGFSLGVFNTALLATAAQYAWVIPVALLVLWAALALAALILSLDPGPLVTWPMVVIAVYFFAFGLLPQRQS